MKQANLTGKNMTHKTLRVPQGKSTFSTAESVARMNELEQDRFVEDIVARYPHLADTLMVKLGWSLLDAQSTK